MFYMFYNYSYFFPKIKCISKKTLYTFVFLRRTGRFCPTPPKVYKKAPVFIGKQGLFLFIKQWLPCAISSLYSGQ